MKRPFLLTPQARSDLQEILFDIAEDSPDAAQRLRSEFYEHLRTLALSPGIGHYHDELLSRKFDAPYGVQKEDEKASQRNELKAPLGELVVPWQRFRIVISSMARKRGAGEILRPYAYLRPAPGTIPEMRLD